MAPSDSTPLSLRPFPVADKKPKNIAEFIGRVNAQPGGFRLLSEAKLREEATRQVLSNGAPDDEDVDMSEGEEEDGAVDQDPAQARMETLKNIDIAGNITMLTLDSLSLLLSKQNPSQASLTLSKQLREVAGIGTLGADRLEDSNITKEKEEDQESIALGWTLMEVNKTRDAADAAFSFLDNEVEMESKYWEGVVGVQSHGWSICRMPQERHTLGVRFGFTEATPEFKSMGLAPMRRDDDGSVKLDSDVLGGVSERLLVTVHKDGHVVGRSAIDYQTDTDAPLEARVLDARNTLFDQELWHELGREARTLAAYDVRPQASSLVYEVDEKTKVTIELVSLDSAPAQGKDLPESETAEAILLALQVLLGYAHRHNELMRIRPLPPHIPRARGQQSYALLRPVIARSTCLRNITSSTQSVGSLIQTLRKAGLESSFTLQTSRPSIPDSASQGPNQLSTAQHLVRNMLQPPPFDIILTLLPDTKLTIRGRTFLFPVVATYYYIVLPPSSSLEKLCPPHKDGYTDLNGLSDYLYEATTRLLTEHFLSKLPGSGWTKTVTETAIRRQDTDSWELRFGIIDEGRNKSDKELPQPALLLSNMLFPDGQGGDGKQEDDEGKVDEAKPSCKKFMWKGHDESHAPGSIESVVLDITKNINDSVQS